MIAALLTAVTIAFPREGAKLPSVERCYMIGAVTAGETNLVVQGRNVAVHPQGGWTTMLDCHEGLNTVDVGGTTITFTVATRPRSTQPRSPAPPDALGKGRSPSAPPAKVWKKLPYAGDTPKPKPASLRTATIVVDAGHGGSDTGALSPHGRPEKDVNLAVAQALRDELVRRGAKVIMTRDDDSFPALYDRPKVAHRHKADAFISIHHNAPPYDRDPRNFRYTAVYAWNAIGAALATNVNARMAAVLAREGIHNNGVPHANFAVTRNPEIPSCLVEVDFITTPEGEIASWRPERHRAVAKAIADGVADWLNPIQVEIDRVARKGGGVVRIARGDHPTGSIRLRSNVTLELEEGARLVASTNYLDYATNTARAVVWALGATNVAIVGKGEIDGRGWGFRTRCNAPNRWKDCVFTRCRNVRLEGVTLREPASWTCYFKECDTVCVRNVTIRSLLNFNNDGFDIDAKNVLIENCDIDSDDDAICLKSDNPNFICENVEVKNCVLASNCNHIKLGTASHGGFRNVNIHHCELRPCATNLIPQFKNKMNNQNDIPGWDKAEIGSRCGIAVECVDGGILEDVCISDITMNRTCQTPVLVRLGRRKTHPKGNESYLRNVVIENITGESMSYLASSITGVPGLRPRNVTLRNVKIVTKGGGPADEVNRKVVEAEKAYPENRMFRRKMLPAYGFYVRHADGVRFENVDLSYTGETEGRPAIFTDDSTDVTCTGCSFQKPRSPHPEVMSK